MTEDATTSDRAFTLATPTTTAPAQPSTPLAGDAAMHETALIADQFGAYVSKHSERLRISVKKETVAEAPLLFLQQLLVSGRGVSVSSDAIEACCERGIPVYFLSGRGEPYAALYAAGLGGTVLTRRAQLMAYGDGRGVAVACAMAGGKIMNQANLLRYMAKYRKATDADLYRELRLGAGEVRDHLEELRALLGRCEEGAVAIDDLRGQLLSIEGRAAQKYWQSIKQVVPETLGWPGREGRGAKDPLNAALNYGYGVLYGQVERSLVLAGLDPYAGFIHVDRPGKPSLTLDLIEEFRAPIVDRAVFGMVNRGTSLVQDEEGMLTLDVRRAIAQRVLERLEESTEPYEGKRQRLRFILQSQARHLAAYLRGERIAYTPFLSSW